LKYSDAIQNSNYLARDAGQTIKMDGKVDANRAVSVNITLKIIESKPSNQ